MTINEFAKQIAYGEGKKKQVNIAQIKEIIKVIDKRVNDILYKIIRLI